MLSTVCTLAMANPTACSMNVHESRVSIPSGYVRSGAAPEDAELKLRIALVQSDPDGLIDALYAVSTPGSASYGKHLSKEEVRRSLAAVCYSHRPL